MIAFPCIALYNVVELNFITLATFKRRSGLYFWSFLAATWGIAPHAIASLLQLFRNDLVGPGLVTLYLTGWWFMVTGQSLVLYSRLHLVLQNTKILRIVLAMIITNVFILHIPITILAYGKDAGIKTFRPPYNVWEKAQVTIFFFQEVIISALYIYEAVKLMRMRRVFTLHDDKGRARRLILHLFAVNVIIVLLDISLILLEFTGLHDIQTSFKVFVYSFKLKIEFSILNRLVELTRSVARMTSDSNNTPVNRVARLPEFVDPERHMQMQNESDMDGSSLENNIWTGPKGKEDATSQVVVQEKTGESGRASAED
ncbi:hypothetical protein QBC34DRAFT_305283 [Podospora aff. communis PSN243]|uniref:DUF7703 domain-containing protein n=1 Tax=Podospora aff. communis PSN243 TaxID=3040156 RepID=A0AAV9GE20_9PEZI|nr:hypothetical protein QBC34DRAFT_305283 [Podospora aff. communis PSN243]